MKNLLKLPQWKRNLIGGCVVLVGIILSFLLCGTDTMGLLVILPFAVIFIYLCPELWRGN